MLVHICCSVDSHYFLEKIKEEFPNEELVGFFYDPNIHPYSEYKLRYQDVKYSCDKLDIELIEGEYDLEAWFTAVKGLENEPEKGDRCTVCFDKRLERTVNLAKELGHEKFTTTLLISPKKSQDKLQIIGSNLQEKHGVEFIFKDYRSGKGMEEQAFSVKENSLYRQNYCGCIFGLKQQREQQGKLMDEMFNPINQQILPESIEERLKLYEKRTQLEESKQDYKIGKQRFLNYRLLHGYVKVKKEVIPSYILCYSTLNKGRMNGRIEYTYNNINYLNRDEVKVIDLHTFNILSKTTYKSVQELMFDPISIDAELEVRKQIVNSAYDLSTIVIVDKVIDEKYEIVLDAKIYEDVKEVILL